MAKRFSIFLILVLFFPALVSPIFALDKVKLGSAVKMVAYYYLPPLAAEEKGFWKENGLDVEWVPFGSGAIQMRAAASGTLNVGMVATATMITAAGGGVPVVMVSELVSSQGFNIWVRADSPHRHPRDLKGTRVAVTSLGGMMHALGRIIVKTHEMEKEVRFVGAGGTIEQVAGLRAGAFDATINTFGTMVGLKLAGIVRDIASASDYLPKPWFEQVVFARKDFGRTRPEVVRKILKATLQSLDFIGKNPRWAIDKMKSFQGLSEEAAKLVYDDTKFTITGKIDRRAAENVRKLFIEYGVITDKAPPVDELFTNEYFS